jgi:hypothetical protein
MENILLVENINLLISNIFRILIVIMINLSKSKLPLTGIDYLIIIPNYVIYNLALENWRHCRSLIS